MKTLEEIKQKIKTDLNSMTDSMFIGMCNGVHPLMMFVPEYYKDEYKHEVPPLSREAIIADMQNYVDFALEKIHDQRGLSATRSMWKFKQWLWALDDDEITDFEYEDYGLKRLNRIIEKYDLKVKC